MADGIVAQYLGHSAFLFVSPDGARVVVDPYDNTHPHGWRWFVEPCPVVEADVVLVTHDHFDHNAVHRVAGEPRVVRSAVDVVTEDVRIYGFEDSHASPDEIPNTIFVLESGGVRVCHLGDNRPDVSRETVEAIGRVDVLIVPVDDSSHLHRFWEVQQLIETFEPRVVVPVHYFIAGVTEPGSTLLSPDTWLGTQDDVRHIHAPDVEISVDALPAQRQVWVLRPRAR
jgi:L-ascorbate metabolism protein UlaG (beta-lactamase superfamily)